LSVDAGNLPALQSHAEQCAAILDRNKEIIIIGVLFVKLEHSGHKPAEKEGIVV
jgi:hypothetical protein